MILKETALTSVLNRLKNLFSLKSKTVFSVNGEEPVNGDVTLREVPLAVNLSSDKTQESLGEFIIRTSGGSASISDGDAFALRVLGNRVHTGYIPESLTMTVNAASRTIADQPITAEIDRDTFVAYVSDSGMTTLTYTTEWSENPALYGITVTGTPIDGDEIVVVYVKENRGTITVANPTALKSTGWNLYNHTAGYAYATKYSDDYGFMIGGTYTAVKFATAADAVEKTTITPVDGMFSIPSDGYIFVEGGNNTDTFIINVWSDWTEGPVGAFEAYSETEINLATIMQTYFANGLLRVGDVRDEINLNTATAISRIDRMAYSAANLATAKASGRAYEYDENYIYIVKAVFDVNSITLDGSYTASDHGNEFFTGTTIPVFIETLYGNNLKNKLERDVVTKSQDIINNLTSTATDKVLSAAQGKAINDRVGKTTEIIIATTISDLETAISALLATMADTEVRAIRIGSGITANGFKSGVTYSGYITRLSSGWGTLSLVDHTGVDMMIGISGGAYFYNSLSSKVTSYEIETWSTAEYSSILAMVNDQVTTKGKALPFSFMKVGNGSLTDAPSGWGNVEFSGIVYGNGTRLTVSIQAYGAIPDNIRHIFAGNWLTQWHSIDSEIAVINSKLNTTTDSFPFNSSLSHTDWGSSIKRKDNFRILTLNVEMQESGSTITLGTLASQDIPPADLSINILVNNDNGTTAPLIRISANGLVQLEGAPNNPGIRCSIPYFV